MNKKEKWKYFTEIILDLVYSGFLLILATTVIYITITVLNDIFR